MNLIEQLGGYDEAKKQGEEWGFDEYLNNVLLQYRRDNNIFEVGDKVVCHDKGMGDNLFSYEDWMEDFIDQYLRHATLEEIKAGKRLN